MKQLETLQLRAGRVGRCVMEIRASPLEFTLTRIGVERTKRSARSRYEAHAPWRSQTPAK
jgi:hypothetical protein